MHWVVVIFWKVYSNNHRNKKWYYRAIQHIQCQETTDRPHSVKSGQKVFGLNRTNKRVLLICFPYTHSLPILIDDFPQRHHHCNLDQVFDFSAVPVLSSVTIGKTHQKTGWQSNCLFRRAYRSYAHMKLSTNHFRTARVTKKIQETTAC